MSFAITHVLSLLLHILVRPYKRSFVGHLETASLLLLALLSIALTAAVPDTGIYDTAVQVIIAVALFVPSSAFLVYLLATSLRQRYSKQQQMLTDATEAAETSYVELRDDFSDGSRRAA
jgi:hypothetical protein